MRLMDKGFGLGFEGYFENFCLIFIQLLHFRVKNPSWRWTKVSIAQAVAANCPKAHLTMTILSPFKVKFVA
jgi:hypothetical protein